MDAEENLPPELQEIADLLWEHAHGAPSIERDKVWWMVQRDVAGCAGADMTAATKHDAHDRLWFDSGWEACRREVLALAEHQGDTAAVEWASRHPAGQHEPSTTKAVGSERACEKCGAYGGNGRLPRIDDTTYPCPSCS